MIPIDWLKSLDKLSSSTEMWFIHWTELGSFWRPVTPTFPRCGRAFTSLVMQPSLFKSYRLNAQLSRSLTVPLKIMDSPNTKSWSKSGTDIWILTECYASTKLISDPARAHLEANRAVLVRVEGLKKEMCVHTRICKETQWLVVWCETWSTSFQRFKLSSC